MVFNEKESVKEMKSEVLEALNVAKKEMPGFEMLTAYDYGDFYYFSCRKTGEEELRTGPCVDKKTLKPLNMSSSDLMILGDFKDKITL